MYADQNKSPEVLNSGQGLIRNEFNDPTQIYRVFGEGYQPTQGETVAISDAFGDEIFEEIELQSGQGHTTKLDELLSRNLPIAQLGRISRGPIDQYWFNNWTHRPDMGEPRDLILEINQSFLKLK